jgi:hypothetical protein
MVVSSYPDKIYRRIFHRIHQKIQVVVTKKGNEAIAPTAKGLSIKWLQNGEEVETHKRPQLDRLRSGHGWKSDSILENQLVWLVVSQFQNMRL